MVIPSESTKILWFNQNQKLDTAPFIIYADLESLIEKIDGCRNNPKKSFTTKVSQHIPSGISTSTVSLFKNVDNKHEVYRSKDFCKSLREHAMEVIKSEKKKKKLVTNEQQKAYQNAKICSICKEKFKNKHVKDKKCRKVKDDCHNTEEYGDAAHSICNVKYSVTKKICIVFHNESSYDYYFIIKELEVEFFKKFTCLGENTEK